MPETTSPTDPNAAIRAAADAITAPPAPDPDRLLETVASIRETMKPDEPGNIYYKQHRLVAAENAKLDAWLASHGIREPAPLGPAEMAERSLAERFPSAGNELEPHIQAILTAEVDALEALGPQELARRVEALRQEIGLAQHSEMVKRAQEVMDDWSPGVAASLHALRIFAGISRYRDQYARAASRLG